MKYSVKKSELEECDEQGMILQLEKDECLVIKLMDLKNCLSPVGKRVYENIYRHNKDCDSLIYTIIEEFIIELQKTIDNSVGDENGK
jgi:hypothetical protein